MLFKGGTSLSKAYSLIERFSEDIDLVFDRAHFGFDGANDPGNPELGSNARERLLEDLREKCRAYVCGDFLKAISDDFRGVIGGEGWSVAVDDNDPECLVFTYPSALEADDYGAQNYVRPAVRLELGIRGDHAPAEPREIAPYLVEAGLGVQIVSCTAQTLLPKRTLWEKALMQHVLSYQPSDRAIRANQSRHYYDVAALSNCHVGTEALADSDLRLKVIDHARRFFRQAPQDTYDKAKPGSFQLVPADEGRVRALAEDFQQMKSMFFNEPPSFDDVLASVKTFEAKINALKA